MVESIAAFLWLAVLVVGGCSGSGGDESTTATTERPSPTVLPGRYVEQVFSSTTETKTEAYPAYIAVS